MNKAFLSNLTGGVLAAALQSISAAAACESLPYSASLCSIVPLLADVRDAPNGRVTYGASGKVLVAERSKNGLWARIEVPCVGYSGWISSQHLTCESRSARAE
jgi:hypothetical protein